MGVSCSPNFKAKNKEGTPLDDAKMTNKFQFVAAKKPDSLQLQ